MRHQYVVHVLWPIAPTIQSRAKSAISITVKKISPGCIQGSIHRYIFSAREPNVMSTMYPLGIEVDFVTVRRHTTKDENSHVLHDLPDVMSPRTTPKPVSLRHSLTLHPYAHISQAHAQVHAHSHPIPDQRDLLLQYSRHSYQKSSSKRHPHHARTATQRSEATEHLQNPNTCLLE
jgi:hypothetical protein